VRTKRPRAIVTDIEGTTTPVAFVHETLFPFARAALPDFLSRTPRPPAVEAAFADARELAGGGALTDGAVIAALLRWIDEDRKAQPLKTLQGLVWADGYRTGELRAPVYDDAAEALREWYDTGIVLAVYSSGSVAAQKLLFGHTDHGNLVPLFAAWFDLAAGSKLDAHSYAAIAAMLNLAPADILFLSDHPGELMAGEEAGMTCLRVDRGDPPPAPPGSHPVVRSFADITFGG
jgi:enolase-phosphatase E1